MSKKQNKQQQVNQVSNMRDNSQYTNEKELNQKFENSKQPSKKKQNQSNDFR